MACDSLQRKIVRSKKRANLLSVFFSEREYVQYLLEIERAREVRIRRSKMRLIKL